MLDCALRHCFRQVLASVARRASHVPTQQTARDGRGLAKQRNGDAKNGDADIAAALAIDPAIAKQFEPARTGTGSRGAAARSRSAGSDFRGYRDAHVP